MSKYFKYLILFIIFSLSIASPFNFREWFNNKRATNHIKKQNLEQANNIYLKNTLINPLNPITHYNLGNTFAASGKTEEALQEWQNALSYARNSKNNRLHALMQNLVFFNKGLIEMQKQNIEKAKQNFINALKINPNDIDAKKNLEILLKQPQQQKKQQQQKQGNDKKNDEEKNQSSENNQKTVPKFSEEEAKKLLDQLKDNKIFVPKNEKQKQQEKNDW